MLCASYGKSDSLSKKKKCEECSLHCNNMQHRLIVDTDISGQHTTPTFKAHALQTQAFMLEWLPFKMGPECCTETLATNYQCSSWNIQAEERPQLYCRRSLKSHNMWDFEIPIYKLHIQDHLHGYSCNKSTTNMPFRIITYLRTNGTIMWCYLSSLDFLKASEPPPNTQFCSSLWVRYTHPPPLFHSVHCDAVKNIKFINAQWAKQSIPLEDHQKRLYKTNN